MNVNILFDSRNSLIKKRNGLFQHFVGYEVHFIKMYLIKNKLLLWISKVLLMELILCIFYHFSSKKALFESTYFSQKTYSRSKYKNNIIKYLNKNFPNVKYKINFKEQGVLPMFSQNVRQQFNYFPIGIPGNWMKSSTGYSFQNCFFYSDLITRKFLTIKK